MFGGRFGSVRRCGLRHGRRPPTRSGLGYGLDQQKNEQSYDGYRSNISGSRFDHVSAGLPDTGAVRWLRNDDAKRVIAWWYPRVRLNLHEFGAGEVQQRASAALRRLRLPRTCGNRDLWSQPSEG
jgi:hypothetical protein